MEMMRNAVGAALFEPLGDPPPGGESGEFISGANQQRMAMAYAKAQDAALLSLRAKPRPCE